MIRSPGAPPTPTRRGLTSILMLIGLLVLGIVVANLLRVERARLDQARLDERLAQVEALADAGVDRALAHLRAHPDFVGETWDLVPAEIEASSPARVVSTVRPDPSHGPATRLIQVTAELWLTPKHSIRQSRTLPWQPDSPRP